jgi:hypothetical protein
MKCQTGKVSYDNKEIALEALVQNRTRHNYGEGSGPINIYQCEDCGSFHFTSRGPMNEALTSDENLARIRLGHQAGFWEDKFKGGR